MISANRLQIQRIAAARCRGTPHQTIGIGRHRRHHHLLSTNNHRRTAVGIIDVGDDGKSTTHGDINRNNIHSRSTKFDTPVHLPSASFWSLPSWLTGDSKKEEDKEDITSPPPKEPESDPDKNNNKEEEKNIPSDTSESSNVEEGGGNENENAKVVPDNNSASGLDETEESTSSAEVTDSTDDAMDEKNNGGDDGAAVISKEEEVPIIADSEGAGKDDEKSETNIGDDISTEEATAMSADSKITLDGSIPDEKADDGDAMPSEETSTDAMPSGEVGSATETPDLAENMNDKEPEGVDENADLSHADVASSDEEVISETIDSTSSMDSQDEVVVPKEASTDELDEELDAIPPVDTKDEIPPEEVIRTGFFKWFSDDQPYGLIIQDKQYRNLGQPKATSKVNVHIREMQPEIKTYIQHNDIHMLRPMINKLQRIQFQAKLFTGASGNEILKAYNVRYAPPLLKGSKVTPTGDIPVLHWPQALTLIRRAKSDMGEEIYNILSEKSAMANRKETAKRVNDALHECNKKVKWSRGQVVTPGKVANEVKTRLGEDMFELLSNIATVHDMAMKADEAYYRCLSDLSDLNLEMTPGQKSELRDYLRSRTEWREWRNS
mmetsp:Transcript_23660/g.50121  ORF Transcript_23660/g.50121 Transcript_23660/m.50121 type:complete len:609 (+) Transcript_23660:96-1922(+)